MQAPKATHKVPDIYVHLLFEESFKELHVESLLPASTSETSNALQSASLLTHSFPII